MTKTEAKPVAEIVNALFSNSPDRLREIVRAVMQEMLEAEMTDALGAEKGERTSGRRGYRAGYYPRTLVTRVGKLELRVPQDRDGRFSTELFERYQRSEQALVATLAEMYVQGVSTRKVKAITEELCGHAFSASAISAINKRLDESLEAFAGRPLEEPFAYLILDARYEKVREGGVVTSQAVLIAIGVDWDGRRQILAVEMANRESRSSWKDFLLGLRRRGLNGVEFVVADDHAGLRMAIREVLPEAAFQRCYVHFLRNALDHLPRKPMTTACRNCAGFTTGDPSRRPAAISPPGSPNGAPATQSLSDGSKKRSRRPSLSTGFRASTISISRAPTCWSASTRRSGGEPMSCASSPTQMPVAASSEP
jgi:putative transposase